MRTSLKLQGRDGGNVGEFEPWTGTAIPTKLCIPLQGL